VYSILTNIGIGILHSSSYCRSFLTIMQFRKAVTCERPNLFNKCLPQEVEVAQGFPGRFRPQIFLTFGTTRVVGRQLYAPGRLYSRINPWYSFLEAQSTPGHMLNLLNAEQNMTDTSRRSKASVFLFYFCVGTTCTIYCTRIVW
jgi:hypothetical protein